MKDLGNSERGRVRLALKGDGFCRAGHGFNIINRMGSYQELFFFTKEKLVVIHTANSFIKFFFLNSGTETIIQDLEK